MCHVRMLWPQQSLAETSRNDKAPVRSPRPALMMGAEAEAGSGPVSGPGAVTVTKRRSRPQGLPVFSPLSAVTNMLITAHPGPTKLLRSRFCKREGGNSKEIGGGHHCNGRMVAEEANSAAVHVRGDHSRTALRYQLSSRGSRWQFSSPQSAAWNSWRAA